MHERIFYSVQQKPEGLETDFIKPAVAKDIAQYLLKSQKICHGVECPLKEKISGSLKNMGKILKTFHQENLSSANELFDIYKLSFEIKFGKKLEDIENLLLQSKIFVSQDIIKSNLNSQILKYDISTLKNFLAQNGCEKMLIWLLVFSIFEISRTKNSVSEYSLQNNAQIFFDYCNLFSSTFDFDYESSEALSIFYASTKLI